MNSEEARFHIIVLVSFLLLIAVVSVYFYRQQEEKKQRLFQQLLGLSCLGTFLLIFVGAMVATTRSGMAFMDWPTSNGLIWPDLDKWFHQKDMFWEHSHRLIAEGVGILAICLVIWSNFVHGKKFRIASIILLAVIILQGVFGGLTVGKLTAWWTSSLHGIVAQLVFAYMLLLFFKAGKEFKKKPIVDNDSWLRTLPKVVCIIVFIQLTLGASFRHKMKVARFASVIPVAVNSSIDNFSEYQFRKSGSYSIKVKTKDLQESQIFVKTSNGKLLEIKQDTGIVLKDELFSFGELKVDKGPVLISFSNNISEMQLIGPERIDVKNKPLKFKIVYKEVLEGNKHLMWAHVAFALVVTLALLLLVLYLFKKRESAAFLGKLATSICICLTVQLGLGVIALIAVSDRQSAIYDQSKTIMTSAHLANGAVLLSLCILAMVFCRVAFVKSDSDNKVCTD